jgi:Protein of unknown function (DUF2726)
MNPYLLVPLVVLAAVLLVLLWLTVRARQQVNDAGKGDADRLDTLAAWPPQATRILTTHERLAYSTLLRAFPDYMVLAQVPLARFLKVPTRHSHAEWLRRAGNLCADLLVCDMASQVVAVIIVQPPGGMSSERAGARRERMARVLKAVGIRMLIWVENALPTPDAAREAILPTPAPLEAAPKVPAPVSVPIPVPVGDGHVAPEVVRTAGSEDLGAEPPPTWYDDLDSRPTPLKPLQDPGHSKR